MRLPVSGVLAALAAATVLGCSAGDSTGARQMGRIVFQIASTGMGSGSGPAAADITVSKGPNVLVLSQVQLVARKIRLRRVDGACAEDPDQEDAPPSPAAPGRSDGNEAGNEDGECPTLKLGPLLLDPPLTDGVVTSFTTEVPVGTYSRLRIQIHKPKSERDQAFLLANPDFAGVSIRVHGTYNGSPFVFDTGIEEEEEITLDPPVDVTAAGTTAFTLLLDVRGWFLDQTGTALLDPTAPSSDLRSLIERNIRRSFRAFRDDDRDGKEDDGR